MEHTKVHEKLLKYVSGLASPEEAIDIEAWRNASPENLAYFEELFSSWQGAKQYELPDVDAAWVSFENKSKKEMPINKSKNKRQKWWAAAAILLLGLGAALWKFQATEENVSKTYVFTALHHQDTIAPGALVQLQEGARLRQNHENDTEASFELEGNATFNFVEPQPRFLLRLPSGIFIKDIGTVFEVHQDSTYLQITVFEGMVVAWNDVFKKEIGRNQVFHYDFSKHVFSVAEQRADFDFEDQSLAKAMETIGKEFHVKTQLKKEDLGQERLTLTGKKLSLPEVMEAISLTLDVQYKIDNDQSTITLYR